MRIKRYDHWLCGRTRTLAVNPGNGEGTPALFYTSFDIANVSGEADVCAAKINGSGTTLKRKIDIKIISQTGRVNNGSLMCKNTAQNVDQTWGHTWTLLRVEYDDATGVWTGETNVMPVEDDYPYWIKWELWLDGCSSNLAQQFCVIDVDGIEQSPWFGVSSLAGLGSGAQVSPLYMSNDGNCTLTGELVDYEDVLPRFLFGMPTQYNVSWSGSFVTDFDTFTDGDHDAQTACYNTLTCAEGSDPDYTGGGTFSTRDLIAPGCGYNWATAWAWAREDGCFWRAAGDLSYMSGGGSQWNIGFGANTFVSSPAKLAIYRNVSTTTDLYWTTRTNTFDIILSSNFTWTPHANPGTWTYPSTITVTPIGYD